MSLVGGPVSRFFDSEAEFKTLVRARVTRVLDVIGVPWNEAADSEAAMAWVLDRREFDSYEAANPWLKAKIAEAQKTSGQN